VGDKLKMLCKIGIHFYSLEFLSYADQPFLTGNVEDELCAVEGRYAYICEHCEKEKKHKFKF
jgi:hypothetical protein